MTIFPFTSTRAIRTHLSALPLRLAILKTNPDFFKQFTVVVATLLPDAVIKELAALLWDANIPLIVAQAYGMLGYMRLAVREHCVVESHTSQECTPPCSPHGTAPPYHHRATTAPPCFFCIASLHGIVCGM